jgi:ketosteroid isomerase-like protein
MKTIRSSKFLILLAGVVTLAAIAAMAQIQPKESFDPAAIEKAVRARLAEIQQAAQQLNPDQVFGFVLENDKGALVQNGKLFLTRKEALASTKRGFQGLQKVTYQFDQQQVTVLSPTLALAVGDGSSSATTDDGRTFNTRFAQTVILTLTNGQWQVLHAHRSFPPAQ